MIENISSPVRPRLSAFSPDLNCNGKTPIPTRFERCIRSKLSAITAFTPNNKEPFAAQSLDEPVPYSLPARTTKGVESSLYRLAASKISMTSPVGKCFVNPPSVPGAS